MLKYIAILLDSLQKMDTLLQQYIQQTKQSKNDNPDSKRQRQKQGAGSSSSVDSDSPSPRSDSGGSLGESSFGIWEDNDTDLDDRQRVFKFYTKQYLKYLLTSLLNLFKFYQGLKNVGLAKKLLNYAESIAVKIRKA